MATDYSVRNDPPMPLINGDIVQDYIEFSGESEDDVFDKIYRFRDFTKPEYHELKDKFYSESRSYIYDILGGNPSRIERANIINKFIPNAWAVMKNHPGKKFADFGGGTGTVCSIIREFTDKEVTYIDVASYMTEFAKFRFKKYAHEGHVNVIVIPEDDFELPENYDIIFTDAVWEHLNPEQQLRYAVKLTSYLNRDGLFFFLIDLSGENPEMPMHFNVDIVKLHNTLKESGMEPLFGMYSFASVWKRT